jgi:hypothetical protein
MEMEKEKVLSLGHWTYWLYWIYWLYWLFWAFNVYKRPR